jgi:hypothetical protein
MYVCTYIRTLRSNTHLLDWYNDGGTLPARGCYHMPPFDLLILGSKLGPQIKHVDAAQTNNALFSVNHTSLCCLYCRRTYVCWETPPINQEKSTDLLTVLEDTPEEVGKRASGRLPRLVVGKTGNPDDWLLVGEH